MSPPVLADLSNMTTAGTEPCPLEYLPAGEDCFVYEPGQLYCNSTWDSITCWPTTLAGRLAMLPCPTEVNGVHIHPGGNASRFCSENGTWTRLSDYTACTPIAMVPHKQEDVLHNYITRQIYYVGFSISTVALIIALVIFVAHRNLHCLRNTIHCHLIMTFILRNCLWFVMDTTLTKLTVTTDGEWLCKAIVTLYNYLTVSTFFWMLVEGLYLHTMIMWALTVERIKFWLYALIGWLTPAIVIGAWVILRMAVTQTQCWLPADATNLYDWVYIAPILAVLMINIVFLGSIVWILITKLRASNTIQTRQYRKAVRATLILFPLLGVTYVLLIAPPTGDVMSKRIFTYFNVILQSTQGLSVAIFYCFLNGEVKSTLRTRISRWQDGRSFASRYTRASIVTGPEQASMYRGSITLSAMPSSVVNGGERVVKETSRNNNEDVSVPCDSTESTLLPGR